MALAGPLSNLILAAAALVFRLLGLAEMDIPSLAIQILILFVAYTDDAGAVNGNFWAGVPLLQKPFTPAALAERVRLALDSGQA